MDDESTDQADIFLFYIKEDSGGFISRVIHVNNQMCGVEFYRKGVGTICRFYNDMTVLASHREETLVYLPGKGTYRNDVFISKHFNPKDFALFWKDSGSSGAGGGSLTSV